MSKVINVSALDNNVVLLVNAKGEHAIRTASGEFIKFIDDVVPAKEEALIFTFQKEDGTTYKKVGKSTWSATAW